LQRLGQLTAHDILEWFNHAMYGVGEPAEGHDLNPMICSNTLKYWKTALSFFMPNRLTPWNEISDAGNPTRSRNLNDLIQKVKKKEMRGQGVSSQARRSITVVEYRWVVEILKAEGDDNVNKHGIPSLMNYQFHMIAHIDCKTQAKKENFQRHDNFDFAL